MNNLTTTTESLPKTGHVNEVCKEWLVREDGALAYKLQSQEINEFYKGNRQRNAVVREDFPTALHEQIKEQEQAQKQTEAYRRQLTEQEEYDKRVANEIADKLERDIREQQQRELEESEAIAQRMQEIYVNMPPIPPPAARDKARPPPRPVKASTLQQQQHPLTNNEQQQMPTSSNALRHNRQNNNSHQHKQQQQHKQQNIQYFADNDGYVGLSVNLPATPQRPKATQHTNFNHLMVVSDEPATPQKAYQQSPNQHHEIAAAQPQYRHQHSNSSSSTSSTKACSPSTSACASSSSASASGMRRNNVFDFMNVNQPPQKQHQQQQQQQPQSPNSPKITTSVHQQHLKSPKHFLKSSPHSPMSPISPASIEELQDYSDVADSIRRFDINQSSNSPPKNHNDSLDSPSKINRLMSPSHENLLSSNEKKFQKLSPEKYDQIMGNAGDVSASLGMAAAQNGRSIEQQMQQHADDIELYVDPCDYESLKEIGLPMEEIKELSKKLKQEQKDALLAKRLQEMESGEKLSQEERDRMLAIEAQDKELAKMLQEREKAKAKRAKEKARQRKSQHHQKDQSGCGTSSGLHCGPLLALPQDCMSSLSSSGSGKQRVPITASPPYTSAQRHQPANEELLDMEAYSNPIDVLNNQQLQQQPQHQQQRQQNGLLTNGSLTRDGTSGGARHKSTSNGFAYAHDNVNSREDDIYTLPVDSCRPTTTNQRPASLIIGAEAVTGQQSQQQQQHNSMTRSENYSLDSHGSLNGHHEIPPRMNYSKSVALDKNSSPTPPYMPIQGTRRSNSGEERKKKSKDKCTHQ